MHVMHLMHASTEPKHSPFRGDRIPLTVLITRHRGGTALDELFGHNRESDLDIGYAGDPDHRARDLKGEIVLSLKIGFRRI
jgi:hypothetical protein